jgi:glycosyltransferase involved in cell wall biosynthesis
MNISVIIPVWNGARYLGGAIASVLAQTLPCSEILVVDDASDDGSAEIAARFGASVRVISRAVRGGPAAVRNTGIRAAQGGVLAFLDADDLWLPDKLEWQAAALSAGAEYAVGWMTTFADPDLADGAAFKSRSMLYPTSIALTRGCLQKVGLLDESPAIVEWADWIDRARHLGVPGMESQRVCVRRRVHDSNWTLSRSRVTSSALSFARAAIARKRGAQPS